MAFKITMQVMTQKVATTIGVNSSPLILVKDRQKIHQNITSMPIKVLTGRREMITTKQEILLMRATVITRQEVILITNSTRPVIRDKTNIKITTSSKIIKVTPINNRVIITIRTISQAIKTDINSTNSIITKHLSSINSTSRNTECRLIKMTRLTIT